LPFHGGGEAGIGGRGGIALRPPINSITVIDTIGIGKPVATAGCSDAYTIACVPGAIAPAGGRPYLCCTAPDRRRAVPLSPPTSRQELHTRTITLRGYERADGLYDIEAQLTDTKTRPFSNAHRGEVQPGTPLHGMWMRMTVDERLNVIDCEAATDFAPYELCPNAAPNFARLVGLRIKPGFLKEASLRVGGTIGCTHLRELLQQMATVAFQTVQPARARRRPQSDGHLDGKTAEKPAILNTCIAYGTDSPVVRRYWPHLYTGPAEEDAAAAPVS
jgi:hypothetical protein